MQDAFEDWMDVQARAIGGEWFDGKVVGVTRMNPDGSSRQDIARTLRERDELELRAEPGNPFDGNAVAIYTQAGQQIGYLEARLAAELTRRCSRGMVARCFVRRVRQGRENLRCKLRPDRIDSGVELMLQMKAPHSER